MDKIHYKIDDETKNIILELKNKCQSLQLGNINFSYFADGSQLKNDINFYLTEYNTYWELVVKQEIKDKYNVYLSVSDIYKIDDDNEIKFDYSEEDIL